LPLAKRLNRPDVEMFHDQRGISILHVVEAIGLRPRDFPDNRHPRTFDYRGRIKKLLLQRKEPSLRLLTIEARLLSVFKRKLQEFDLRAVSESLRFQHLTAKHEHTSTVGLRRGQHVSK